MLLLTKLVVSTKATSTQSTVQVEKIRCIWVSESWVTSTIYVCALTHALTHVRASAGQIMGTITQRLGNYGICLRGDISACLLTISVSEGLLLKLDPGIDIVTRAAPYFVRFRSWQSGAWFYSRSVCSLCLPACLTPTPPTSLLLLPAHLSLCGVLQWMT
jgi:hypothetical protein|eukprot:COSAG06_NODE_81_length_25302_cov_21.168902_20_plen_160_part_00